MGLMARVHLAALLAAAVLASVSFLANANDVPRRADSGRSHPSSRLLGKAGKSSKSKGSKQSSKGSKRLKSAGASPTNQPTTPVPPTRIPTSQKPTAAATDTPVGTDCAARQQMATILTEDVCLRDRTVGVEACPECASSCDYISSGSTFDKFDGSFYSFTVDRQQNGRTGIWFNLLATESDGIYMSLYKGTFCGGLTCVTSRDGGPCPGLQESDLDDGEYVLFIHSIEDSTRYDLEFTFKGEELSNGYPDVCSV